ncbi:uncharacterized protein LOC121269736 isoform X1 [Carcharodon carcharias]|uniref:uncharacterized protein LOC121269736 isoform X1 n=2 Tax=Carcharodon carcharias TaxID=13397 RepID=UPI001B7E8691|nr:uncharacterized protein LOC121269736 isoform X1 [Carcharodon carcharias]XP_041030545.1 uncharacterized protein LOC121269736 isoform X1 [Carcharodon carcharias]XP_041030546.1 uncharacterized protein LOC121269736 isoform X1 [Carcharodon carcharias]
MATSMDTTEKFLATFTTLEFESYEDFSSKLETFQQVTGSLYQKVSTHTLKRENKRRRIQVPSRFKYASVKLHCVHYGQPRIRSTGVRPNQRYLAMGCKAFITVKFVGSKNRLCVTAYHLVHTGHVLDPQRLHFYARRRQLNQDERKKVEELVKLQTGNKQLKDFIQQTFNKTVTLRDIRNLKTQLKARGDSMDSVRDTLVFHNKALDQESSYPMFLHRASLRHVAEAPADLQSFNAGLTSYTVKLVHQDHSRLHQVSVEQQNVTARSAARQYTLKIHDGQPICCCKFSIQTSLPCKHAIAVQRHLGLSLEQLIPNCLRRAPQSPMAAHMAAAIAIREDRPRLLSINEKYCLLSDQLHSLGCTIMQSGTVNFWRHLDCLDRQIHYWEQLEWLERQNHCWQRGLPDEMKCLEGARLSNVTDNWREALLNGDGSHIPNHASFPAQFTEGQEDIIVMPPSQGEKDRTPWPTELMDHTYAYLYPIPLPSPEELSSPCHFTLDPNLWPTELMDHPYACLYQAPLPSPEEASSLCPVTVGEPDTSLITAMGTDAQTSASTETTHS